MTSKRDSGGRFVKGSGSVTVKDNGYNALMHRLKSAQPIVRVGVFGNKADAAHDGEASLTIGALAEIHEFGLGVPERAWLRGYVDENSGRISRMLARIAEQVTAGKITPEQGLNLFGLQVVGEIKERLPNLLPPLAKSTIDRKGSSATLIDKGQFRSSIAHQVDHG